MASVKVFGNPTSAEVARVLTCLFEKDVEFQLIRVENYKGRQRKPEYLKVIADSRAICRYVAERYVDQGNRDLLGSGTLERASIEQWLQTEAQSFDPPSSALVFHLAFAPYTGLEPDEEVVKKSMSRLEKVLNIYEQRLEETKYLAGDNFTLADLSHLPNAHRLITRVPDCALLFKQRKRVMKWWEAISGRDSWSKVVEMQQEAPAEA